MEDSLLKWFSWFGKPPQQRVGHTEGVEGAAEGQYSTAEVGEISFSPPLTLSRMHCFYSAL